MKRIGCLFIVALLSCSPPKHKCALRGISYGIIDDIPGLEKYAESEGAVIGGKNFGLSFYTSATNNFVSFEFLRAQPDGKSKYEILDTLNLGPLPKNQSIGMMGCLVDSVPDNEIFALISLPADSMGFDKIIKAWQADTMTNTIVPITNLKGLSCVDQDYSEED